MADTCQRPFAAVIFFNCVHQSSPIPSTTGRITTQRSVVEGMGLDWKTQYRKLKAAAVRWGVLSYDNPSAGGSQEMVCLPIRKYAGWLYTINPVGPRNLPAPGDLNSPRQVPPDRRGPRAYREAHQGSDEGQQ
jgi:hypothetical protein